MVELAEICVNDEPIWTKKMRDHQCDLVAFDLSLLGQRQTDTRYNTQRRDQAEPSLAWFLSFHWKHS